MKTRRSADIASGCFLFLLGIVVLIAASQIRGGMEERLPPRTLPYIVGAMILVCGAGLTLKSWRSRGPDAPIQWPGKREMIRIAVSLLAIACFIALMDPLGLPLSTALYVTFTIRYLRRSGFLSALLIGVAAGLISYYLFIVLLELSFPVGVIFGN